MGGPGAMAVYGISPDKETEEQYTRISTKSVDNSPVVIAYWPEDRPNQYEMDDKMCSFDGRCIRT